MKIGLFYGSTTCYTEIAAEKIQEKLNNFSVELHNIKDIPLTEMNNFDIIILGISTWDYGELQEDWEAKWDDISALNLENKIIALYGMGDQIGYTDWFQDALGMLHEEVKAVGAYVIGYWPNKGYEFAQSKALTEDKSQFVGLSLDEDNQSNLSEERIVQWCKNLEKELEEIFNSL
jgi:flavodoxin II